MNLEEFIFIYKKSGRNLDISAKEIETIRMEFKEHRDKWKKKNDSFLRAIYGEKEPPIPKESKEEEAYQLIALQKDNLYQVEIFDDAGIIKSINAGFGDVYFSKKEKDEFIQVFRHFCRIKSITNQISSPNPMPFRFYEKPNLWAVHTSKLRYESWDKSLIADSLGFVEVTPIDFERWIYKGLDKEIKKAMDFFEVSINMDKLLSESKEYYLTHDCQKLFEMNFSINKNGIFSVEARQKHAKEFFYEYQ